MDHFTGLASAGLFWLILHTVIAGPLREPLAGLIGEPLFRGLFSIASVFGIIWMVREFNFAPTIEVWQPLPGAKPIAMGMMLVAFLLLALAAGPQNPTSVPAAMKMPGRFPVHGVFRVTRHPMLWAFSIWALAHLLVNTDIAAAMFFGPILVTALNGMGSIDRKRERSSPQSWGEFAAQTSIMPFAAIAKGRNRLVMEELSGVRLALAIGLFLLFFFGHGVLIGVPLL